MASILYKWLMVATIIYMPSSVAHSAHPIFLSVTEIEHNAKDKTLEISCRIFTDDFEKTLRQTYSGYVDLINPKDKAAMDRLVSGYVTKHLSISVDGKPVTLQYVGYEHQEEGILSYYQVNNVSVVNKIDITNNILYDYKKEQIGIVHVVVGGNRKSTKLNNPDDKASFSF